MVLVWLNTAPAVSFGDTLSAAKFCNDSELVDLTQVISDVMETDLSMFRRLGIPN